MNIKINEIIKQHGLPRRWYPITTQKSRTCTSLLRTLFTHSNSMTAHDNISSVYVIVPVVKSPSMKYKSERLDRSLKGCKC